MCACVGEGVWEFERKEKERIRKYESVKKSKEEDVIIAKNEKERKRVVREKIMEEKERESTEEGAETITGSKKM